MSGAFKPVEDVSAPGVVDLVEWVSVGLLHGHCIAKKRTKAKDQGVKTLYRFIYVLFSYNVIASAKAWTIYMIFVDTRQTEVNFRHLCINLTESIQYVGSYI